MEKVCGTKKIGLQVGPTLIYRGEALMKREKQEKF
jgi:hypothetical protein